MGPVGWDVARLATTIVGQAGEHRLGILWPETAKSQRVSCLGLPVSTMHGARLLLRHWDCCCGSVVDRLSKIYHGVLYSVELEVHCTSRHGSAQREAVSAIMMMMILMLMDVDSAPFSFGVARRAEFPYMHTSIVATSHSSRGRLQAKAEAVSMSMWILKEDLPLLIENAWQ